ncbi:MAG: DUF1285 domain-containing protein [Alphaproteobacteria bacterium]|nr:DUF1285 domain-containing protein [Alphaproteobacteria bacterium]
MSDIKHDPLHWGAPAPDVLRGLAEIQAEAAHTRKLPPVEQWNPPFCGDLDIRIGVDGTWFYLGTPIGRPGLVRLFSTILRRDVDGKHYLVTPVEKVGIRVDDAPFIAVRVDARGSGDAQELAFSTNVGDSVVADAEHPLTVHTDPADFTPRPYLRVRGRLDALVSRAVFYELVSMAETRQTPAGAELGVTSRGVFFPLGKADP